MYRKLLDAGVQTVVQVAAWPSRRLSHWLTLCRARAIENQMYVLACAAAGTQAGLEMTGHSLVIDPWGEVLAEADAAPTTIYAEIDPAYVPTTRERFPVLRDRRL
jgi:predicted amidohydrolase